MVSFERYVALGDSMSIDRYPSIDLLADGIALLPHPDRVEHPAANLPGHYAELPVGAASLFARNDDTLWPEFAGRDLATVLPHLRIVDEAFDGATIGDVAGAQLARIRGRDLRTLVTLTAGGNDLLLAFAEIESNRELHAAVRGIVAEYEGLVASIGERFEDCLLILTTVYDPSDGTGFIPGFYESGRPLPLQYLDDLNAAIRGLAGRRGARLADAHAHFLGHGARSEGGEAWYWPHSMIEPSARGASEIRALWLAAAEI